MGYAFNGLVWEVQDCFDIIRYEMDVLFVPRLRFITVLVGGIEDAERRDFAASLTRLNGVLRI